MTKPSAQTLSFLIEDVNCLKVKMITLRLFVIFALVLSTAQLSDWKKEFVDILKKLINVFPIPYTTRIDLICSGKDSQLWFKASGTLDKDEDVLNGLDPALNNIEFSVNASNFKVPIEGRYTCKVSFQTYTYGELLLLNLTGSSLDVTEFVNNDFMKALYSSFVTGSGGISYNNHWKLNPSATTSTSMDSPPRKDYRINLLYPIINELILSILHLPKSLMTKLFNIDSLKKSLFGFRKTIKPSKQGHYYGENYFGKQSTTKGPFKGKNSDHISASIRTKYIDKQTDVNSYIQDKNEYSRMNFKRKSGSKPIYDNINDDKKITRTVPDDKNLIPRYTNDPGKQQKSASVIFRSGSTENKFDDKREKIAAFVAVALFSVGIIGFTTSMILGLVIYHKYVKVRHRPPNMETGSNDGPIPAHIALRTARNGPGGMRLAASRSRGRFHSAPVTSQVSNTPKVQQFTVQPPQEQVSIEIEGVLSRNRITSEIISRDPLPKTSTNENSLRISESSPNFKTLDTSSQCTQSNFGDESASYSHVFQGRHLNTLRKVSTNTPLPYQSNAHDTKITLIYVKPVDTQ